MLVCNSGKRYMSNEQEETLLIFLEDIPVYRAQYRRKGYVIECLGHDLPIGAITADTQKLVQLDDQTHNYHTPLASNTKGYARIWYTKDTGEGPKHGVALSPEWFKLIDGCKAHFPKKKAAKMSAQTATFFERMKAERRDQETERTQPTVAVPPAKEESDEDKDEGKTE